MPLAAACLLLHSAVLASDEFEAGKEVPVRLVWEAQQDWLPRYTVFVHLFHVVDGDEEFIAQHDGEPLSSTESWVRGSQYSDTHRVRIPATAAPGTYVFRVGMYPSGNSSIRLPVVDGGRTSFENDSILVAEIQVIP